MLKICYLQHALSCEQSHSAELAQLKTMVYIRTLSVIVALFILGGCATVSPPQVAPDFRGIESPSLGYARIYLFRPAFISISHSDAPWLELDGERVFRLGYGVYTQLQVKPGVHRLSLRPEFLESKVWLADREFSVESDQTYFLAIWNGVTFVRGDDSISIPMAKGAFFIPLPQPRAVMENKGVRMEFVSREDALPILEQSRYVGHAISAPKATDQ